jgi:hypothetical protein
MYEIFLCVRQKMLENLWQYMQKSKQEIQRNKQEFYEKLS